MTVAAHAGSASDELGAALLRTVSHDVRTPLAAILAAGSALAESQLSLPERAELARAVADAERLSALMDKLLDLSRISGSGPGLAIVKGFVEANGGRVRAASLPGRETSFAVTLPIARGA